MVWRSWTCSPVNGLAVGLQAAACRTMRNRLILVMLSRVYPRLEWGTGQGVSLPNAFSFKCFFSNPIAETAWPRDYSDQADPYPAATPTTSAELKAAACLINSEASLASAKVWYGPNRRCVPEGDALKFFGQLYEIESDLQGPERRHSAPGAAGQGQTRGRHLARVDDRPPTEGS
jgi:hypothetical protein